MQELLEVHQVQSLTDGHTIFVNAHKLWHPPQARGVYGGVLIAQSLVAAQRTVPDCSSATSMRCSFLAPGSSIMPVYYKVQQVDNGSSKTRIRVVRAVQSERDVFLATIRFIPEPSTKTSHDYSYRCTPFNPSQESPESEDTPFLLHETVFADPTIPMGKRYKQSWLRPKQKLSSSCGPGTRQALIAFFSDSYFITTAAQVHGLNMRHRKIRTQEQQSTRTAINVEMMVSLDHIIHFHGSNFNADDWICAEMKCTWVGQGRALVSQKMFSRSGSLLATCVQEVSMFSVQPLT